MLTLDYNSVISYQYSNVEKSKKKLDFFNTGLGKWANSVFLRGILKRIMNVLTSQLLHSKGILLEAKEHSLELQGKSLTKGIESINGLLNLNIRLQSLLAELCEDDKDNKYPELHVSNEIVIETIENFYSIIRVLKRANAKEPKETSDIARDLSRASVKSLEKVLYGN